MHLLLFDQNSGIIKADNFVTYYVRSDAVRITFKKQ